MIKKGLAVAVILLFIGMCVPSTAVKELIEKTSPISFDRKTIYVDDDNTEGPWHGTLEHPFKTVQDGYNAAVDGNTVYVFNGFYNEDIKNIEKSIKFIGEDRLNTILEAPGSNRDIFRIMDRGVSVTIKGFTLQNCDGWPFTHWAIRSTSDHTTIVDNYFKDNDFAIFLRSSFNIISNNDILDNKGGISIEGGFNFIYKNNIIGNDEGHGIYLDGPFPFPPCNIILRNNFIDNDKNAYFVLSRGNRWMNNYWDDWSGVGPKRIDGIVRQVFVGFYPDGSVKFKEIEGTRFDWFPAKEPHDI